ncbi:MAG: hypothetical protein MUP58_01095 [Candidatus Nanohaloarchaeota archaeon QJJ-9]|nr:hypothetical protein [Candidatus Nanohaloarchaeota archaeon QJJ-9]
MGENIRSIKNVDEKTWKTFKAEATKHGMTMGEFLTRLVSEHRKREKRNNWDEILSYKESITKKEAEEIKRKAEKLRKDFKTREYDPDA